MFAESRYGVRIKDIVHERAEQLLDVQVAALFYQTAVAERRVETAARQLESARASNGDPAQPKHTTVPLSSCTFPSQNSATSSSRSNPELTSLPGSSPDMLVSSLAPDLGPHTCCSHSVITLGVSALPKGDPIT